MANRVKIQLMGNLGADPEARVLEDGTSIASFSLAVNDWRGRAKGGEEITTWYRVSAWRRQAEIVTDLLRKGMNVYVEGGFQPRMYTNRAGHVPKAKALGLVPWSVRYTARRNVTPTVLVPCYGGNSRNARKRYYSSRTIRGNQRETRCLEATDTNAHWTCRYRQVSPHELYPRHQYGLWRETPGRTPRNTHNWGLDRRKLEARATARCGGIACCLWHRVQRTLCLRCAEQRFDTPCSAREGRTTAPENGGSTRALQGKIGRTSCRFSLVFSCSKHTRECVMRLLPHDSPGNSGPAEAERPATPTPARFHTLGRFSRNDWGQRVRCCDAFA
jgi:single-stranded DNA-binding protein